MSVIKSLKDSVSIPVIFDCSIYDNQQGVIKYYLYSSFNDNNKIYNNSFNPIPTITFSI